MNKRYCNVCILAILSIAIFALLGVFSLAYSNSDRNTSKKVESKGSVTIMLPGVSISTKSEQAKGGAKSADCLTKVTAHFAIDDGRHRWSEPCVLEQSADLAEGQQTVTFTGIPAPADYVIKAEYYCAALTKPILALVYTATSTANTDVTASMEESGDITGIKTVADHYNITVDGVNNRALCANFFTYDNGTELPVALVDETAVVSWSINNDNCDLGVEHNEANVTAVKVGKTKVTARVNGYEGSTEIIVTTSGNPVDTIVVAPIDGFKLKVGESQAFTAHAVCKDGTSQEVTESADWEFVGDDCVTQKDNLLTGKATGAGILTATYANVTGSSSIYVEDVDS